VDLRFVKPLDKKLLSRLALTCKKWYIFSDSAKRGGVGEILLGFLNEEKIKRVAIKSFEYTDNFIQHGDTAKIEEQIGLSPCQLAETIMKK
jgi:1-deoxy-D-xylulose-5-phosphate synthase